MRRALAGLVFLLVVLGTVGGAHLYLAHRLVVLPAWAEPWRSLLLSALALLFAWMFFQPIAERVLGSPRLRWLSWPPLVWMGVLFLAFFATLFSDVALGVLGMAGAWEGSGAEPARARAVGVALLTTLASAVGMRNALRVPDVRRLEVRLARWPEALSGLRIAQISDIHIGPILGHGFAAKVVSRVNGLAPDLIAVTGDLVDGPVTGLYDEVAPFAGLEAPLGTFFVTGNHDYYSGDEAWVARAVELGIEPLRNRRVRLERGGAAFDLAGVDDYRGDWRTGSTHDLPRALDGRDPERALVLLAHDPASFPQASRAGVDFQLSGHTHGGQIWPFRYFVRLAGPFVAGLSRRGASTLYVSRGTGFWGPPMRLFAPAEITEITLRPA